MTCRKRKVRCKGGNPCQNCARRRAACISSFENNMRISLGAPSNSQSQYLSEIAQLPASPFRTKMNVSRDANGYEQRRTLELDMREQNGPDLAALTSNLYNSQSIDYDLPFFDKDIQFLGWLDTVSSVDKLEYQPDGIGEGNPRRQLTEVLTCYKKRRAKVTSSLSKMNETSLPHVNQGAISLSHFERWIVSWNYRRYVFDYIQSAHYRADSPFQCAVLFWAGPSSAVPTSQWAIPSKAEITISSVLFLCRCDVLNGDATPVLKRLDDLKEHLTCYLDDTSLSALACKFLYKDILSHPHFYRFEIFGQKCAAEELVQDTKKVPVSVRTHEIFCLISNMLQYTNFLEQRELAEAKETAISLDIRRMDTEFDIAIATNPTANTLYNIATSLGRNIANSFLINHAANGNQGLHSFLPADTSRYIDRASLQCLSCYVAFVFAKGTLTSQMRIPRSILWPLPLFIAGIETTDEIYAGWISEFIDEMASAMNGGARGRRHNAKEYIHASVDNIGDGLTDQRRIVTLMMRIRESQDLLGRRVDVHGVVSETEGINDTFLL
ncbi:hypothetical protein V8C42DRAFT_356005 [Trichoderma barbatum]